MLWPLAGASRQAVVPVPPAHSLLIPLSREINQLIIMQKLFCFLLLLSFSSLLARPAAAQVGIGGTPDPSAALDVKATNKAFYPPRLSTMQRQNIPSPQPGALVYDSDKGSLYLYDGQSWLPLGVGDPNVPTLIARTATDGTTYDRFGSVVAITGD